MDAGKTRIHARERLRTRVVRTRVLVAGATGYIGRRLVTELVARGHHVRCLARNPRKLDSETWSDRVEVVAGDVLDRSSLDAAFAGVDAAYYLVHSIGADPDWRDRDRTAAENFRDAAAAARTAQIIYLGGLGDDTAGALSAHLASRHEVGRVLASGPVPSTELRAAIVIGSGSTSFEMLRHLVEVLPVMTTPRWVETRVQPIAVEDVLTYLTGVLGNPDAYGQVFEIGGPDVVTYRQLMDLYAEVAGLRRRVIVPVPVLSPRLSSLWVGLVTPIPAELARPLIDSLVNEVVVHDHSITTVVPHRPIACRDAIALALRHVADLDVSTRWTDAELYGRTPADPIPTDPDWAGATVFVDAQRVVTPAPPTAVFAEVASLGGDRGWLVGNRLWAIRGWIDLATGGVGLRRGRRHATDLRVSRRSCCACAPRCACRVTHGSSGRSAPRPTAPRSSSAPCSAPAGSTVVRTGTRWRRSTDSSSGRSRDGSSISRKPESRHDTDRRPPRRPAGTAPP
jgi:uncharacterized protein YbjT (DUF2867 family)